MPKKMPPREMLDELLREELDNGIASKTLPANASDLEKIKYKLCEAFVIYKRNKAISSRELATALEADEALVSKILHYYIEEFTVDRLIKYLSKLNLRVDFAIKVA